MKNIILLAGEEPIQFDTIEELKEFVIPNWSELTQEELEKELYEKVFGLCHSENLQIASSQNGVYGDHYKINKEEAISPNVVWIDSIELYLLSLCQYQIITILEEKENRYFTKDLDIKIPEEDNYVVVNAYVKEILKKWGSDKKC